MEILHFSHQHLLEFIQDQSLETETAYCFGCDQSLEGPRYGCKECKYFLHKKCAQLPRKAKHPFHPQHTLILLTKLPYINGGCDFCYNNRSRGFVYHCNSCSFDLHVNCASLQASIASNFPTCLHQHPLLFVPNHNEEVKRDCSGCMKPLSGPLYHCGVCSYPQVFNLHKECAELPLEINHLYDRKHPLTLLPKLPTHPPMCRCYLCRIHWEGFVYSCSVCNLELTLDDLVTPPKITVETHKHPWKLLLRQMSFICDFCGVTGDHSPYLCTKCNLVVHKKCISMPCNILITRHPHMISHSYSLQEDQHKDWTCRICYEEVNSRYGSYYCSDSDCDYTAHVHCATNKAIWDGTIVLEDNDERCKEKPDESLTLITDVLEQTSIGGHMVATEIKHAFHDHNLRLVFSGEIKDDSQCDGCMKPISTPFYSCDQCKFSLHKDCAELPREKRHPFHKHSLTLTNSNFGNGRSECSACWRTYQGFSYHCYNEDCLSFFTCDIRCILLSDTLKHPSHKHSLFLVHGFPTKCSGCLKVISDLVYRCMKQCDFTLDIGCVALPLTSWYKYDKHPLTLTYTDESSPSQHYCDLCENERDPNDWFYYCTDCDNSLHSKCVLGDPQFMKLGSKLKRANHPHPLTFVKNIWNCPPCKVCRDLCNGVALECKESECNFTIHYRCRLRIQ